MSKHVSEKPFWARPLFERPRRNRANSTLRALLRETSVHTSELVFPLFLNQNSRGREPISSMPGLFRLSQEELFREIEECLALGLQAFALFPVVGDQDKDSRGTFSLRAENFYLQGIRNVKERFPETVIISDVAMDPYSSEGHDGIVIDGNIINDPSVEILATMALAQAQAGVDIVGPSDMMDGRVRAIREILDRNDFLNVGIMAYTAKYASAFYGPFREALDSAPKFGDKKTYQMDPANRIEALREARLDVEEGADILMVKPALSYLDVISDLSQSCDVPIAAYNVSGEYSMVKAAAQNKWIDEKSVVQEILTSIKRAGAKVILTYFAKQFAMSLQNK